MKYFLQIEQDNKTLVDLSTDDIEKLKEAIFAHEYIIGANADARTCDD
jgi:hypothetical protein